MHAKHLGNELSTGSNITAERKRKRKEKVSPSNPLIREKQRVKKLSRGFYENPLSPRPPARTRREHTERYRLAGAAAQELVKILGSTNPSDSTRWAFVCYHFDEEKLFDKAYEYASLARQNEINNPVRAFQKWLTRHLQRIRKEVRG